MPVTARMVFVFVELNQNPLMKRAGSLDWILFTLFKDVPFGNDFIQPPPQLPSLVRHPVPQALSAVQ